MAVASYGAVDADERPRRTAAAWGRTAAASAAAFLLVAGAVLAAAGARQGATTALVQGRSAAWTGKLMGYDPFKSNSRVNGANTRDTMGDFATDEDGADPLPSWATEWSETGVDSCEPGAQCRDGPNPLGALGRWVMIKTSPHFNSPYDEYRRKKCKNLPGWAIEECHRMRAKEHSLDELGKSKEQSAAKGMPMMLRQYRMHPAVRRALPARWQHMRRAHRVLAREASRDFI